MTGEARLQRHQLQGQSHGMASLNRKKADTLFPTVCNTTRGIAGIVAAAVVSTQLEHQDPQILARANLTSEDEDEDNTQPIDIALAKTLLIKIIATSITVTTMELTTATATATELMRIITMVLTTPAELMRITTA